MKQNLKKDILFFLYNTQVADKKLLRSIGKNYDFTGRRIKALIDSGLISVNKLPKKHQETYLKLTDKGQEYIFNNFNISSDTHNTLKLRSKGSEAKYRALKLSNSLAMLYKYFPEWPYEFQDIENNFTAKQSVDIKNEIKNRRSKNEHGDFLFTTRELRDIHTHRLKNISGTRAQGIFCFGNNFYIFFNHNRKRMRKTGEYEEKYKDYIFQTFEEYPENAIHFARSYQVALDTFNKQSRLLQGQLIIDSSNYKNNYYVPLTSSGVKQLMVYTIPDFKNKISEAILTQEEINNSKNTIFDGCVADDTYAYFGFECNLSEIQRVLYAINTVHVSSDIILYCFPHQSDFYSKLFGNRVQIKILTVDDIVKVLKKHREEE